MHILIRLFSLLLFSSSTIESEFLQQQIGTSCSQTAEFSITSFSVSPWPIVLGQISLISFSGVFNQNATVDQISTGLQANQQWTYQTTKVGQVSVSGQFWSYNYTASIPSNSGNYLAQITFLQNFPQQYLACWQFTFTI